MHVNKYRMQIIIYLALTGGGVYAFTFNALLGGVIVHMAGGYGALILFKYYTEKTLMKALTSLMPQDKKKKEGDKGIPEALKKRREKVEKDLNN